MPYSFSEGNAGGASLWFGRLKPSPNPSLKREGDQYGYAELGRALGAGLPTSLNFDRRSPSTTAQLGYSGDLAVG